MVLGKSGLFGVVSKMLYTSANREGTSYRRFFIFINVVDVKKSVKVN
jgi:hypothetical protein